MSYTFIIIGVVIAIIFLILIRVYFRVITARCKSKVTLLGKTALVTGGSSGIGYQIAIGLASRGCRVILAQRNTDEKIEAAITRETNNPNISLEYLDLSSFESVRDFVSGLNSSLDKLDILINNAGVGNSVDTPTKDGLPFIWQINYYGPFLLTYLLIDLLKKSGSGRIIFTSSIFAHVHNVSVNDIHNNRINNNSKFLDYPNTKFMAILASDFFATKLKRFNIVSNAYHPGIVGTPILKKSTQHFRGIMDRINYLLTLIIRIFTQKNEEEGAQTALHLAIANEVAGVTGEFFGETTTSCKPRRANNQTLRDKVWKATESSVNLNPDEVLQ